MTSKPNSLLMNLDDKYTPQLENNILNKWKSDNIFDSIWSKSKLYPKYDLMDGPPFVSSESLHYGHLLVGNAKSTMNYYKLMKGFNVYGKIGYDCHGLPIEMKVNELLNISNNDQVYQMGIDKYNAKCTEVINSYSGSWIKIYDRIARMVDFDYEYKTKDVNFMESVWWGFSELHKKGLAYRGYNVVPFSIGCNTSISNFEAKQNYKKKDDMSLYVKFPVSGKDNTYFVAWTTTPWTLPSHLALAVNPKMIYVTVKDNTSGDKYIIAESNIENLYKNSSDYTITESCVGDDLVGTEYIPPFLFFEGYREQGAFRVYSDNFVKVRGDDDENEDLNEDFESEDNVDNKKTKPNKKSHPIGTGVVHCAPGFGADDFNMCTKHFIAIEDIGNVCPVDEKGCFTNTITDYAYQNVFDVNNKIIKDLEALGVILKKDNCKHKYPYCWRTDTPLIYKAVKSFFVRVTSIKDRMMELNKKIFWVPNYVGHKRFDMWLDDAKDWGVSRSRFYGTPIPAWVSDNGLETIVIGSIDELVDKAGLDYRPDNLHPEFVNHIQIPSDKGNGMLKRVDDVFDCWFESGSVPFAQHHFPMENKEMFDEKEFLAEFICEGIDQTRGWFYTLNVLSTALFDKPAFQHCVCTGLILAEDGKKMSKRLKNYPDPHDLIDKCGADALRLYLINSPAIRAGSYRFKEEGVMETKKTLIPWFESLKFLNSHVSLYLKRYNTFSYNAYRKTDNVMDQWILSCIGSLVSYIDEEMAQYKLYTILPKISGFIDNLTNWYVKLNRQRLKGIDQNQQEWECALAVLYHVLFSYAKISAPFTPFMSEYMFSHLKLFLDESDQHKSIFMCEYPEPKNFPYDVLVETKMRHLQHVMNMVRLIRTKITKHSSIKVPLKSITIANDDNNFLHHMKELKEYLFGELNCLDLNLHNLDNIVKYSILPNHKNIGTKYKKDAKNIKNYLTTLNSSQINEFMLSNELTFTLDDKSFTVTKDDAIISPQMIYALKENEYALLENNTVVIVDFTICQIVIDEYVTRMINYNIQQLRKEGNLTPVDNINVRYYTDSNYIQTLIERNQNSFESYVKAKLNKISNIVQFKDEFSSKIIIHKEVDLDEFFSMEKTIVQIYLTH